MEVSAYVLVIEDDEGNEVGRLTRTSRSGPPTEGLETPISFRDTNDPRLFGMYRIRAVRLLHDRDPPVKRRRYTVPVCYARRVSESEIGATEVSSDSVGAFLETALSAIDGNAVDPLTIALAGLRDLATRLKNLADDQFRTLREGGKLEPSQPQLLHDLSRVAKQLHTRCTFLKQQSQSPPRAKGRAPKASGEVVGLAESAAKNRAGD